MRPSLSWVLLLLVAFSLVNSQILTNTPLQPPTLQDTTLQNSTLQNAPLQSTNSPLQNAPLQSPISHTPTPQTPTSLNSTLQNSTLKNSTLQNPTLKNSTRHFLKNSPTFLKFHSLRNSDNITYLQNCTFQPDPEECICDYFLNCTCEYYDNCTCAHYENCTSDSFSCFNYSRCLNTSMFPENCPPPPYPGFCNCSYFQNCSNTEHLCEYFGNCTYQQNFCYNLTRCMNTFPPLNCTPPPYPGFCNCSVYENCTTDTGPHNCTYYGNCTYQQIFCFNLSRCLNSFPQQNCTPPPYPGYCNCSIYENCTTDTGPHNCTYYGNCTYQQIFCFNLSRCLNSPFPQNCTPPPYEGYCNCSIYQNCTTDTGPKNCTYFGNCTYQQNFCFNLSRCLNSFPPQNCTPPPYPEFCNCSVYQNCTVPPPNCTFYGNCTFQMAFCTNYSRCLNSTPPQYCAPPPYEGFCNCSYFHNCTTTSSTGFGTTTTGSATSSASTTTGTPGGNHTSCATNNGGCDYRVICGTDQYGDVYCGDCPNGTYGSGFSKCLLFCGDGVCDASLGENCVTCFSDCNATECDVCGDGVCGYPEKCTPCPFSAPGDCIQCVSDCYCGVSTCTDDCNNHGTCTNGACECDDPWSGPYCEAKTLAVTSASVINPNPTIELLYKDTQFDITIKQIAEMQGTTIVRKVDLSTVSFSAKKKRAIITDVSANLQNGASVALTVGKSTSQKFSFNIRITNWPFMNLTHSLAISFDTEALPDIPDRCIFFDNSGNVLGAVVELNDVSLYANLNGQAEIDGREMKLMYYNEMGTIAANLPHFWRYAEMTPTFTVLNLGNMCKEFTPKKKNLNRKVIAIFFPSALGLVILAVAFSLLYRRYKIRRREREELKESAEVENDKK